jgi:negative regulator of sigma E activity
MNSELDEMLGEPLLEVPDGFAARVLERVSAEPRPTWAAPPKRATPLPMWQRVLRWLALGATFLVGAAQLATFMLGLWMSATAA